MSSLSVEAVDRLFKRLAATYGAAWDRSMGTAPLADVKTVWGHALAGFAGEKMHCIAWALEHLPERCPNVLEFRNLCRQAPLPEQERLPAPKADPAKAQQVLAKVRAVGAGVQAADPKAWAHRIMGRVDAGDKTVSPYARKCAEMALGKRKDMGA